MIEIKCGTTTFHHAETSRMAIEIDLEAELVTIAGVRYDYKLFELLALSPPVGLQLGEPFKIVARGDKTITIMRVVDGGGESE